MVFGFKKEIQIDGKKYTVKKRKMTPDEILALTGKTFKEWSLNVKRNGGRRDKLDDWPIFDFKKEQYDRFETVSLQAQQG